LTWVAKQKADYHLQQKDDVWEEWTTKYPQLATVEDPDAFMRGAVKETNGKTSFKMLEKFSDNILLEFALILGILHVSIGLLRYIRRNWAGVGWLAFLIGGYLYIPNYLNATSMLHVLGGVDKVIAAQAGHHLLLGGLGSALFLAILQHKFSGVLEIMNLVQVFADILSYLRLYALGLAGSIVSATVNEMASSVAVVAGILILLVGHSINILLSVMGGVIHGLRLNFLEWYHYCFEGGGKILKPLRRRKTDGL